MLLTQKVCDIFFYIRNLSGHSERLPAQGKNKFTKMDMKSEENSFFCVYALIKETNGWNG